MSLVEDETRERNMQALKDRIRMFSQALWDLRLKQKQEQAAQIRWWKPSLTPMFPKKRQFHGGIDIHE